MAEQETTDTVSSQESSLFKIIWVLLFVVTVVGCLLVYTNVKNRLMEEAARELQLLQTLRSWALEEYLGTLKAEIVLWSSQDRVRNAFKEFKVAWDALGDDAEQALQRLYIFDNPNPLGEKDNLIVANDGSRYSEVHRHYHPWMRRFLKVQGYYDVFLFDLKGNLIYTAFKEEDYATNLVDGKWRETGLGQVFRGARDGTGENFVYFVDFAPYGPSYDQPASFMASPIYDEDGKKIGVLAFQAPSDRINKIMQFTNGMGETGETYIVGEDFLMRSDSRFQETSSTLKTKVETDTVKLALQNQTGVQMTPDYRGIMVLSAYGPLQFEGVKWAVMSEKDAAEVMQQVMRARAMILLAGILIFGLIGTFSTIIAYSVQNSLSKQDM